MTVYHGSNIAIPHPEIRTGKYTKDFGTGFYCTIIREQAERWARRFSTPVVNTYAVTMANDQIYNYISDFMEGVLTREQFWTLAQFKYPTHQIAFCSPAALSCLEFVSSEAV